MVLPEPARRPILTLAFHTILASLTACLLSAPARTQGFPTRPIKIVVGPSPDVFSRIVGEHLQQAWGQPVIVEPRPGAGGKLAAAAVASADPDGHTLLFATPTYTLNAAMKLASYDLVKEFEAVSIIGLISYALVVHPGVPGPSPNWSPWRSRAPVGSTARQRVSAPSRISPVRL
jgi:tripartite-type tricarboxylate transporter receptor subunit TctC